MSYDEKRKKVFLSYIEIDSKTNCWNWTSSLTKDGYGQFHFYRTHPAHVVSYMLFKGKINPKLECDHLCENKRCVNPNHLRQITHAENLKLANTYPVQNKNKTHCKYGHGFTPENTYTSGKGRQCKICTKDRTMIPAYAQNLLNAE